jgi:hypothetical protein
VSLARRRKMSPPCTSSMGSITISWLGSCPGSLKWLPTGLLVGYWHSLDAGQTCGWSWSPLPHPWCRYMWGWGQHKGQSSSYRRPCTTLPPGRRCAGHTEFCAQFYWAQRTMWYDQFWASKLTPIGEK